MGHLTTKCLLAAAFLLLAGKSAFAEVKNVPAGRTSAVASFSLFDPRNCAHGPKPKVTFKQPEHGMLSAKWLSAKSNQSGMCNSKTMKFYMIYYQPKAGYRGPDKGAVSFFYPTYVNGSPDRANHQKLDILVK
ncbi:MAG: hypothetical protein WCC66_05605 [Rhizobiaceae bacterium]